MRTQLEALVAATGCRSPGAARTLLERQRALLAEAEQAEEAQVQHFTQLAEEIAEAQDRACQHEAALSGRDPSRAAASEEEERLRRRVQAEHAALDDAEAETVAARQELLRLQLDAPRKLAEAVAEARQAHTASGSARVRQMRAELLDLRASAEDGAQQREEETAALSLEHRCAEAEHRGLAAGLEMDAAAQSGLGAAALLARVGSARAEAAQRLTSEAEANNNNYYYY